MSAYVGRTRCCGRFVAAVADIPGAEKDTSKDVADMIANGYVVERVEDDVVRQSKGQWGCSCAKADRSEA